LTHGVHTFIDPPPHSADPHVKFSLALFNLGVFHRLAVFSNRFSVLTKLSANSLQLSASISFRYQRENVLWLIADC
jgi:hypothetical protein